MTGPMMKDRTDDDRLSGARCFASDQGVANDPGASGDALMQVNWNELWCGYASPMRYTTARERSASTMKKARFEEAGFAMRREAEGV
jgi:hypothetical protein